MWSKCLCTIRRKLAASLWQVTCLQGWYQKLTGASTLQRPVQLPAATWNRLPSTMPALSKIASSGSSPVHMLCAASDGCHMAV